jgi:cold-inducible RNA-binding protein
LGNSGEIQMTNIFVGNLSFQTTDVDLEATFSPFGTVERASVVRDRDTGQSRGFGFIEMTDRNEATKAINSLNGQELNGRAINVNEARPREEGARSSRGPSGGGGRGGQRQNRW